MSEELPPLRQSSKRWFKLLLSESRPRIVKVFSYAHNYGGSCKNCVETVFFILAIGWALNMFIYTDWYKPTTEHPQVVPTTKLEKAGQKEGRVALKTTVTVKNTGKVKVKVLSAHYNVIGYKVGQRAAESVEQHYPEMVKNDLSNAQANGWEISMMRYFKKEGAEPLHCGNLLLESWLEPGEEYERGFNVYVPDKFDFVRIGLDVWVARDAQFLDHRPISKKVKTQWTIDEHWGILQANLIINNCFFCLSDNWHPLSEQDSDQKFLEQNGISHNDSITEISLW